MSTVEYKIGELGLRDEVPVVIVPSSRNGSKHLHIPKFPDAESGTDEYIETVCKNTSMIHTIRSTGQSFKRKSNTVYPDGYSTWCTECLRTEGYIDGA